MKPEFKDILSECYNLLYFWNKKSITTDENVSVILNCIFSSLKEIDEDKFYRIINLN